MYAFLIVVHIFVCIVLIAVILLQAGRGGGLAEIAGNQPQSILGTQTNTFMTRATEVCAVIFILTSISLGLISTHRGKSLVEKQFLTQALKTSAPAVPATAEPEALDAAMPKVIADTAPQAKDVKPAETKEGNAQ